MTHTVKKKVSSIENYQNFERIDGKHPWQTIAPEACVLYSARELKKGRVTYFNFNLAKDMGLITKEHPEKMNSQLEKILLKVFNLRIINEYDLEKKISIDPKTIKPQKYMATRYLQLQHDNKKGATSGDGRAIWNGIYRHRGKGWDVNSRGTGVTSLSPGYHKAKRPIKSGNSNSSYGCGRAELDELYSTAIYSEIFHKQDIPTERVLLVIDHGGGYGIGVRASLNLFRPAHLFNWAKQGNFKVLKKTTDYLIQKKIKNKEFVPKNHSKIYDEFLNQLNEDFSKLAAFCERQYVFTWMGWDGDNVLLHGGIIDYGSIRHFGIRHDQYRYDDIERWSTNLNEQKGQFKIIIQTFIQIFDFLKTGQKKNLNEFKNHKILDEFEKKFSNWKILFLMRFCGFQNNLSLYSKQPLSQKFLSQFERLEKQKSLRKNTPAADGTNKQPLLNMRKWPHVLMNHFIEQQKLCPMKASKIYSQILSEASLTKEQKPFKSTLDNIKELQDTHIELIKTLQPREKKMASFLKQIKYQTEQENPPLRLTGDGVVKLTEDIIKKDKKKEIKIQKFISETIKYYENLLNPRQLAKISPIVKKVVSEKLSEFNESL